MLQFNDHIHEYVDSYLHGALDPDEAQQVEQHCARCPTCQGALEEARKRLAALQTLAASEASEQLVQKILGGVDRYESRRKTFRRLYGWGTLITAAAAILILGG